MVSGEHKALSPSELEGRWNVYFEESDLRKKIVQIAQTYPEERALSVDFVDLDGRDSTLADNLLQSPTPTLEAGEKALSELLPGALAPPHPIRLRVHSLPASTRVPIHLLREKHLGKFLAIEGIIRRATEVRPQVVQAVFECAACRAHVSVPQDEGATTFREPVACDSCQKPYGKTRFTLLPEQSRYLDWQKVEVQENPEKIKGGAHPEGLPVVLTEDLVGDVVPGHRVIVNGRLQSVARPAGGKGMGRPAVFDLVFLANSIEKEDREYLEIEIDDADRQAIEALRGDPKLFDRFVDSLAPSIQEMRTEKEAIALQLFGGVAKEQPDGIKIRGDIHVLICGDPGLGKSQLLRHIAENIAPRGIYTSGKGATAAGLTAAVVKDEFAGGRWTLEAGAMVLADQGLLCIDELDKMNPNDRSALHTGLEQQVISVAKAGINATLRARCPVLAAANPKFGRFQQDEEKAPAEQIDLPPTLLSRFDVIFALKDVPNQDKDRSLAGAILTEHLRAEARESSRTRAAGTVVPEPGSAELFSTDFIRKFIAYARRHVIPVMDDAARQTLLDFFLNLRKQAEGEHKPIPITLRQVEGLVRLTEASARARLSPVATIDDANRAIHITEVFLKTVLATKGGGLLDIDYITVGTPLSYRDQIGVLRDIMRELQQSHPEGFRQHDVIEAATTKKHIPADKARRLLDELMRLNEVYSPKPGVLKLME